MNLPLGAALELEDGDVIKSITGKITKLYNAETKSGSKGEYSLQNGEIETEHGPVRFSAFDNELPQSARGKQVTFISGRNPATKKLIGLSYNLYNGKESVKLSAACQVEYEGQSSSPAEKPSHGGSIPGKSHYVSSDLTVKEAIKTAVMVHGRIDRSVREDHADGGLSEETLRCHINAIFIALDRQGILIRAAEELRAVGIIGSDKSRTRDAAEDENDEGADDKAEDEVDEIPMDDEAEAQEDVEEEVPAEDWADSVMIGGPHKGKKFAVVLGTGVQGRTHLKNLCLGYNEKGFNTSFSRKLRQFCLDTSIVKYDEDAENGEVQAIKSK